MDLSSPEVRRCISGVTADKGKIRPTMEDTYTICDQIFLKYPSLYGSFYAVFDGHGGSNVARLCEQKSLEYFADELMKQEKKNNFPNPTQCFQLLFERLDRQVRLENPDCDPSRYSYIMDQKEGCTAAAIYVGASVLWSANVGDTEILLGKYGSCEQQYCILSEKHNPVTGGDEYKRILASGGFVAHGRVNASLAVSRAIGDGYLKRPEQKADLVSTTPHVSSQILTQDDQFVVIASDGLWDVLTYDDVYSMTCDLKTQNKKPDYVSKELVQRALALKSRDNVTALVIYL